MGSRPPAETFKSQKSSREQLRSQSPATSLYEHASKSLNLFHNLVALANEQDGWGDPSKSVWREAGQPPKPLNTIQACFEHAGNGAIRGYFILWCRHFDTQ